MRRERLFLIAFAVLLVTVFLREVVVGFLTDWWWFSAVGYESVFIRTLSSRILLFIFFSLFFLLFFFGNLWAAARRGGRRWMEFYSNLQIPREVLERFRKLLVVAIAVLISMALGAWASDRWLTVLQALNVQEFGLTDPIFGKDVGFYFFTLPLLQFLKGWGLWMLAVTAGAVLITYWESKALGWAYGLRRA